MSSDLNRRMLLLGTVAGMVAPFLGMRRAYALNEQPAAPERPLLLTNIRLFDGVNRNIRQGVDILMNHDRIDALPGAGERVEAGA